MLPATPASGAPGFSMGGIPNSGGQLPGPSFQSSLQLGSLPGPGFPAPPPPGFPGGLGIHTAGLEHAPPVAVMETPRNNGGSKSGTPSNIVPCVWA